MENMSVQHSESTLSEPEEEMEYKETTIVAVSSGDGISELFKGMGVDYIVSGGQTMNPSTDDFLAAFNKLNTKNIIVFPNNSNIIMAAKQAAENYDKANVVVIETKTIAQCYSALSLLGDDDLDSMLSSIEMALSNVTSFEVTYAIRDSKIDEFDIKENDFLGFVNHKMATVSKTKLDSIKDLFNTLEDLEEKEVVTILYGSDVSEEEIEEVVNYIESTYNWMEVGAISGGQKVYSFIVAVE
jgi:dihydroxyacetone kinase-like predicted kinase